MATPVRGTPGGGAVAVNTGMSGTQPGTNSLQGNLTFDNGLPASGVTVRLYDIGFAGQDAKLGETKSDGVGHYSFTYSLAANTPTPLGPNLQVRALDASGNEITISKTKFNASQSETLNLIVPASVQPLAPEFQRLSSDVAKVTGNIAKLGQAQEDSARQDLTLLNQSTNWDARLVALAATAVQLATTTGLGEDVLYALLRAGLPSDPLELAAVPSSAVQQALGKANKAGIVSLNDQQITQAISAFQSFASKTLLQAKAPGAASSFSDLLASQFANDAQHQTPFANLFFSQQSAGSGLWSQATQLGIPAPVVDALRFQGKFLHLTFNNAPLAAKLQQQIGSIDNLPKLADNDYHLPATWQNTIKQLAGTGGDAALAALIPPKYTGSTTADRLAAYAGDLARKVRISFPTQVVARMVEAKELAVNPNTSANVANFLRSASKIGYSLGRTPLNAFLANHANVLPALDDPSKQSLKMLHRLYQVTPSNESLQAALKLGFTSAFDITSHSKKDFIAKFAYAFPAGEAELLFGQAQVISSVTFNVFSMAKALDTAPPLYALSSSTSDRQAAKNALGQQFPSMATLFGNLDFCECEECRSVLSPAAYFVDLLDLIGQNSAQNDSKNTPLDVLIGKQGGIPGRRPDLGALPLTCANTNTAMPYIDLVNEIFEYYIAHKNSLDTGAAYDTGSATTADLVAEPQRIIPAAYAELKNAVYPLNLPFDLWIETVRGFLKYFNISLDQVLETFRPADTLELFASSPATNYSRAQILAEALGISPAEYAVFTATDQKTWFKLYDGDYSDGTTATSDLKNAKTLSQKLGLTYQDITDLLKTGFLNPGLWPLIFQFERFGIDMGTAFSFTSQPGYPPLNADDASAFQAQLDSLTSQYKQQNPSSTFDATKWLKNLLPANYSQKVLVLADPNTGCDFSGTTVQYADGSAATPLDFWKLNLFVRLWKKLGWTMDETDRALQMFFPSTLPAFGDPGFSNAFGDSWRTALVYLAHLDDLNTRLQPALGRVALLPLWSDLPTEGEDPLYAQLFLTPSVLNSDFAFDDPNGGFPLPSTDMTADQRSLSAHAPAVQGALPLMAADVDTILNDAGVASPATFSLANLSLCYRYSMLAQCLQISVSDLVALKAMSPLDPFARPTGSPLKALPDDVLLNQTIAFVKQITAVQNSGFTVEDLKYLLLHEFDPVGKYRSDPNALIGLVQSMANGLSQIEAQNAVPSNLSSLPETPIDQMLSTVLPAALLKTLFAQLTNSQTYTASETTPTALNADDFASASELTLAYDNVTHTQTLSIKGLLLDWRKAEIRQLNKNSALNGLLDGLLDDVQERARVALDTHIGDLLGSWASLAQYEAAAAGVPEIAKAAELEPADASISFSYDQSAELQWLGYRGVLTDGKMSALTALNSSPTLATLLKQVQDQALPQYNELVGSLLAMWCNVQIYKATQTGVAPTNQIDVGAFSAALTAAQQSGTITDPVPLISIAYDSGLETQTLICNGVLTDGMRSQLAALIPSTVLSNLLQAVRNEAVTEFQVLATGLLPAALSNNPDLYVKPFLGLDSAKQQKFAKSELVKIYLPLLGGKLSRQYVIQSVSASLGSDPQLTEALISDAGLLHDPKGSGQSLLQSFLAMAVQGVSASYYSSPDKTGTPQATTAASADTTDPSNKLSPTGSCRFEGYLQVPTDGPYRFFAELGNNGVQVTFTVDAPDPTALAASPVLQATAAKDGDEASQFVLLKGGVAYHFSLDFLKLGSGGAKLLIQGENLPKGPLSQIILYPQAAVDAFGRAKVLLSKVLQILAVTGLDVKEVSYLTEHAADFNNLSLSDLPTQANGNTPAQTKALFLEFLTLADYADLRKGPAGATDGLIDVFQAASQASPPVSPATLLANLTRRDPKVVQDVATALGSDPHFSNNIGIRRMWEALQAVQVLGIPVQAITDSTSIITASPASPDAIAANFKNAVKAQFTADQWRPIAKSVFDPIRRKKRDALVSYLVNEKELESANQLFEYFLVDPGMEPVVQTSRLRLALSSVQTFIQRCFLNLENGKLDPSLNVAPSAIPADWWSWMKRYRVWEANREIFLFPENWMEPELRLDKTDLFQALESALLQGDVTQDLVEDAFFDYLKGLDLRARLEIIASYLDQDATNPGDSTLYVLGRTYGHPHKYFFRTYSNGTWSGWEAVTFDIEGDHVVLAFWRGRLNLFWLTFIVGAKAPAAAAPPSGSVASLDFGTLAHAILANKAQKQVQIQLHWSEYVQGKWTNRISTDVSTSEAINVDDDFDAHQVHPYVSKEVDANGNEGALRVHIDFQASAGYAFRVTSKNCGPDFSSRYYEPPPPVAYWFVSVRKSGSGLTIGANRSVDIHATFYTGYSDLEVSFYSNIHPDEKVAIDSENILSTTQNFALLTCANPVVPPFLPSDEPLYEEAGGLVSPFFFEDTSDPSAASAAGFRDERTFFVQPSLTETVIQEWDGWAIGPTPPSKLMVDPNFIDKVQVVPQVPTAGPIPISLGDPVYSVFAVQNLSDSITDPAVAVTYSGVAVARNGGIAPATSNGALSAVGSVTITGLRNVSPAGATRLTLAGDGATPSRDLNRS